MSLDPKPDCQHCHCSGGLFTDTMPLHNHDDLLCHNCRQEVPAGSALSRCTGCYRAAYCSKTCQDEAWKGHRTTCKAMSRYRKQAAELSGNPNAWAELMDYVDFHHDSFVNAALQCYLMDRATSQEELSDVAAGNYAAMCVWYRNDPTLPVGQKFELRACNYYRKRDLQGNPVVHTSISLEYERAVLLGKARHGDAYRGTGTYLLEVRFGTHHCIPCKGHTVLIPFVKHFAIDDKRAAAHAACRDPFQQLKENLDEGKKTRFCCGPLPGRSTCCCGGWTHEQPVVPRTVRSTVSSPRSQAQNVASHHHCDEGLFHSEEPMHTHPHCKSCFRMRRCEGNEMKLLRCGGCSIATYCSKACQTAHWRTGGHKYACRGHAEGRDTAIELSGNPQAWSHLAQWVEFHHASLINAAIALYLHKKDKFADVTAKYILHLSLQYWNEPSLPPERQFALVRGSLTSKDDPAMCGAILAPVFMARPAAVQMGKLEMSDLYWGTGAYVLAVRFSKNSTVAVPFTKPFSIDKVTARARPACRNPLSQLMENVHEGRKMKFCCGKLEGLPTCCCGGWTHEISGHKAKVGW